MKETNIDKILKTNYWLYNLFMVASMSNKKKKKKVIFSVLQDYDKIGKF